MFKKFGAISSIINTCCHNILTSVISVSKNMSAKHNPIKPPEDVRGMTVLDKEKFSTAVVIPVLTLKHAKISEIIPHVKKYLFKMPHLKPIQHCDSESTYTSLLLNPEIVQVWADLDAADREVLESRCITEAELSNKSITIKYENYNADEIFKAVLPSDQEGFSSFSQVGHIIHVNLRDHLILYKNLIAQVLLDKIPNTRTVVNKVQNIDNTYRNFQMEVVSGENDMVVNIKENRCEFKFDFSKVYWNPRLSTEHERLVKMLKPGNVLFDVFAGVGPFSIPAAKQKCTVFANDLNPESYKWLNYNLVKNKIDQQFLKTFNKDGKDFILTDIKPNLIKYLNKHNIHIVMNLPALAVEFLHVFNKIYREDEIGDIVNLPVVHVYCFAKGEDYVEIAKNLVFKNIGFDISDKLINIFKVRTVSSMKEMMRVSFKLDRDILVGSNTCKRMHDNYGEADGTVSKKCCHGKEQVQTDEKCI